MRRKVNGKARLQMRTNLGPGMHNLRRYFELIVFQSYLQSIEPDTMRSFESIETYVKNRPGTYFMVHLSLAEMWPLSDQDIREGTSLGCPQRVDSPSTY